MTGKILNDNERTKGENMRKNLCIVLIILICFATTYTYAEETENQTTNTTTDLQTQRSELQNQLDEANGQLNDVQSNLSENLQQVEKLDNKIETSEQTLAEQESKITELKNNIQNVETELNSVIEKYDKQVELFKKRMVAIYMAGDTQYLDVLLKSSSLSDFISSYYLISELTEIEENFPDPTPTPMENNPSYRKEIWTGNFSSSEKGFNADCYVRMMVSYSDDDIGRGVEILGMDTVNWVYSNEDGYYYYRNVVAEGEKTTPLCTGFRIDSAKIDDTYKNSLSDFAINIYEESVQAEGFEDFKSAWRYFDNPISGNAERGRNG